MWLTALTQRYASYSLSIQAIHIRNGAAAKHLPQLQQPNHVDHVPVRKQCLKFHADILFSVVRLLMWMKRQVRKPDTVRTLYFNFLSLTVLHKQ